MSLRIHGARHKLAHRANDKPKSQSSLDVSLVAWTVTCGSVEQLVGTGGGRCRNTIVNGRSVYMSLIRAVSWIAARIYSLG